MTLKQKIKHAFLHPIDMYHYLIGNYRFKLYYNDKFKHLLSEYIVEQINCRINEWMDKECFDRGSCKMCGCMTTALQMANKSCNKPCYPPIMSEKRWESFKGGGAYRDYRTGDVWLLRHKKLFLYAQNTHSYVQVS